MVAQSVLNSLMSIVSGATPASAAVQTAAQNALNNYVTTGQATVLNGVYTTTAVDLTGAPLASPTTAGYVAPATSTVPSTTTPPVTTPTATGPSSSGTAYINTLPVAPLLDAAALTGPLQAPVDVIASLRDQQVRVLQTSSDGSMQRVYWCVDGVVTETEAGTAQIERVIIPVTGAQLLRPKRVRIEPQYNWPAANGTAMQLFCGVFLGDKVAQLVADGVLSIPSSLGWTHTFMSTDANGIPLAMNETSARSFDSTRECGSDADAQCSLTVFVLSMQAAQAGSFKYNIEGEALRPTPAT